MAEIHAMHHAGELARSVTVRVRIKGLHTLRCRLWVAAKLITLAAMIAGTRSQITTEFGVAELGE